MQRIHYAATAILLSLVSTVSAQQITGIAPKQIIGGKGEVLTITGSGFGGSRGSSYVSFFREGNTYTDATTGNAFNYLSWSNTEIKLEMPVAFSNKIKVNINGTDYLSTDTLKVKANLGYRQANPLLYDLLTDNNKKGGVTWLVHPVYWNNPEIKQAIADVVQEFRCKTGVNYILEPLTQWVPLNLGQGKHIIAPDSSLGVVGFNDRLWASCILGAETFYHNQTQLLRFNTQQNWYYGKGQPPAGAAKFRYVLFHEMGHSLGLGHVNEWGESMYPTVTLLPSDNWCKRDTITAAEQKAIKHYISLSQNFAFRGCGITPMKPNIDCKDVFGLSVGVESLAQEGAWLFPNPASNQLQVKLPASEHAAISLWDTRGRKVLSANIHGTETINLPAALSDGIYMVRLSKDHGTQTTRLIVQR
ncbi:MAG: T9SS type A sorting domain-containing protein [Sphingomonadales bacterium]|nr:T9SS type A sorting domain-containing protein [Sphingomonadales bacterium]